MNLNENKCYMCQTNASNMEHVPPKCIFPEAKDVSDGNNYRKNLITVPSCEIHNNSRSKDDEYLLFVLVANILSNNHARNHFNSKVIRAINRRNHVYENFAKENKRVTLEEPNGTLISTVGIKVDRDRFDRVIDHIAHGIFFYHFKERFVGEAEVFSESFINLDSINALNYNVYDQNLGQNISDLFGEFEYFGDNPEIFQYQLVKALDTVLIRLIFYSDFKVTACLRKSNELH